MQDTTTISQATLGIYPNSTAATPDSYTISIPAETSAYVARPLLDTEVPEPPNPRRSLSQKEKDRRKKKQKQAARSRRRNR